MCETPAQLQGGPKAMRQSWRLKNNFFLSEWEEWIN